MNNATTDYGNITILDKNNKKKTLEIRICPIKKLYLIAANTNPCKFSAILCSSYPINEDKIERIDNKLCLEFDDITDEKRQSSFDLNKANEIKTFVDSINNNVDSLYICCDSGESRSTALAAAITRYLGEKDKDIWCNPHYHPNPLVYKTQCQAFKIFTTRLGMYIRIKQNENALKKIMRRE